MTAFRARSYLNLDGVHPLGSGHLRTSAISDERSALGGSLTNCPRLLPICVLSLCLAADGGDEPPRLRPLC
jgi:hypothetical protein